MKKPTNEEVVKWLHEVDKEEDDSGVIPKLLISIFNKAVIKKPKLIPPKSSPPILSR